MNDNSPGEPLAPPNGIEERNRIIATAGSVLARLAALILLLFSAAAATVAFLFAYQNLSYALDRAKQVFFQQPSQFAQQPPTCLPQWPWAAPITEPLAPYAGNLCTTDLSGISSVLVLATALFMMNGALSLLARSWPLRTHGRRFPFPAAYRGYYVQYGLLGTIYAFTLAFSSGDVGGGQSSADTVQILFAALGTALWSTLVALFLAYGACPLFELVWQGLRRRPSDPVKTIEDLSATTVVVTAELRSLAAAIREIKREIGAPAVRSLLKDVHRDLGEVSERLDALSHRLADSTDATAGAGKSLAVTDEHLEELRTHVTSLMKKLDQIFK